MGALLAASTVGVSLPKGCERTGVVFVRTVV